MLRNGKTLRVIQQHGCGHDCQLWNSEKCCACSDKRPRNSIYIAYSASYLADKKKVGRNYHYCPTCKVRRVAAAVEKPTVVAPPFKLDFSKYKPRHTYNPAVVFNFPPSVEQQLADAKTRIASLEEQVAAVLAENALLVKEKEDAKKEQEFEAFCSEYYDILRSHWNVAGAEMDDEFKQYKKMGWVAYNKHLKAALAKSHRGSVTCYKCNWQFGNK